MRLYLIRHPQPEVPAGCCYGRSDLPLRDSPLPLAESLAALLPPEVPLFTSPLRRCRELAQAIDAGARLDPRLAEIDFGNWELQSWESIGRSAIERWAADPLGFVPPGGESVRAMADRVIAFARDRLDRGDAAVVAHQGPLRVLAATLLRQAIGDWLEAPFVFGAVTLIEHGSPTAGIRYRNRLPTPATAAPSSSVEKRA